jgi:hypothetical protein
MSSVDFWIPVKYEKNFRSWGQWIKENVDFYFYFKSINPRVGIVAENASSPIHGSRFIQRVIIQETGIEAPVWKTALKVISWFTVIIPVLMLGAKLLLRKSPFSCPLCRTSDGTVPVESGGMSDQGGMPVGGELFENFGTQPAPSNSLTTNLWDSSVPPALEQTENVDLEKLLQMARSPTLLNGSESDILTVELGEDSFRIRRFIKCLTTYSPERMVKGVPCLFSLPRESIITIFLIAEKNKIFIRTDDPKKQFNFMRLLEGLANICDVEKDGEFALMLLYHMDRSSTWYQGTHTLSKASAVPQSFQGWTTPMEHGTFQDYLPV